MRLTQAILPVAGFGTRFLPWTKVVPKELLPIGNKPIIALLVDECMSVGITDICFVISKGKETIPKFFEPTPELDKEMEKRGKLHLLEELTKYDSVKFTTVYQNDMKGDGHAILQAKDFVKSEHLAILFGDDLIAGKQNGLEQLCAAMDTIQSKNAAMLCLQHVPNELIHKYGIVDVEESKSDRLKKIKGLVEKPKPEVAPSNLGIIGKYIIPRSTVDALANIQSGSHDGEIRLIDAFKSQLGSVDIYGYEAEGERLDTGTPEGYRHAVQALG